MTRINEYFMIKKEIKKLTDKLNEIKEDLKIEMRASGRNFVFTKNMDDGVELVSQEREKYDKEYLKEQLTPEQHKKAIIKTKFESLREIPKKRKVILKEQLGVE